MLLGYLLIINAAAFLLMRADKQKARKRQWRIPEATLFGAALLGGSLGILLGMYVFRHKTRKPRFYALIPLIFMIQMLLILKLGV